MFFFYVITKFLFSLSDCIWYVFIIYTCTHDGNMVAASRDRRKNGKIFSRILVHAGARFISGLVEGWKENITYSVKIKVYFGINNIEISLKIR